MIDNDEIDVINNDMSLKIDFHSEIKLPKYHL